MKRFYVKVSGDPSCLDLPEFLAFSSQKGRKAYLLATCRPASSVYRRILSGTDARMQYQRIYGHKPVIHTLSREDAISLFDVSWWEPGLIGLLVGSTDGLE